MRTKIHHLIQQVLKNEIKNTNFIKLKKRTRLILQFILKIITIKSIKINKKAVEIVIL